MSDTPNGRFCWYELMSTDPEATHGFYKEIAGWDTMAMENSPMDYTVWMNGEAPIGGLMSLPPEVAERGAPSHWMLYISTPDVKATAAKATSLGATIMAELDIPEVGQITVIQDPQGAIFSAFQPSGMAPGHDGVPNMGEISWHELMTTDWQAAWAFYSEMFGWSEESQMDMGEMGMYHMFKRDAHALGGMMNRPPDMPVCAWLCYVRVPDVAAAIEKVKTLGGTVLYGPMEVPGGDWVAQCIDPTGAAFAVHATSAE